MAKTSSIQRNLKRIKLVKKFFKKRENLKKIIKNKKLPLEERFAAQLKLAKIPRNSATNNRKDSIQPFLKNYNIEPLIISDSKVSIDKKKQLKRIKNKLKVNFDEIHFVDDQVRHFSKLIPLGIKCYLATWGYNNEEQQEEAKKQGAIFLNKDNFYKELVKKHNV